MKPKNRCSFSFSQMILFFYITISLFLLLGIISTESTMIAAMKVDLPSEIRAQHSAIEAKIANKTGPTNLLAVSSVTEVAIQAKVSKSSSISSVRPLTTAAVPTPISSFLAPMKLLLSRKALPKVNSEIRNSFSDTVRPNLATTGFPVSTFTPDAMPTMPMATAIPTAIPTATEKPKATAKPTETTTPKATVTPKATAKPTETTTPKATSTSITISTFRSINMYTKPNTDSVKKQKIPKGVKLTNVTEKGKGWLRATYKGKTGFVHYLYTSFLEEKKIFSPKNKTTHQKDTTATITADRVNLRSHPGITSKSIVIDVLPENRLVKLLSHADMMDGEFYGWYEVEVLKTGQRGYIYGNLLCVKVAVCIDSISKGTNTDDGRSTKSSNENTSTDSGNTSKKTSSDSRENKTDKKPSSDSSEKKSIKKSSSNSSQSKANKKPSSDSSEKKTSKKTPTNCSGGSTGKKVDKDEDLDCGSGGSTGKKVNKDEDLDCGSGSSNGKKSTKTSKKSLKA